MSELQFFYDNVAFRHSNEEGVILWLKNAIESEGKSVGEINLIYLDDDALLELNKTHLDHDYYTDIITFDNSEDDSISGELYMSIDRITENATKISESLENEVDRVLIHGTLHLLGYKDKTDSEISEMRDREDYYLHLRPFVSRGT